jgi:hypothetical protein
LPININSSTQCGWGGGGGEVNNKKRKL